MIALKNIEKYLTDQGDAITPKERESILATARSRVQNGILMGKDAQEVMGERAEEFFKVVSKDPEHIQLGIEECSKALP